MATIGDFAPSFALSDQNGDVLDSKTLNNKGYIIYFYPRDLTKGCTLEANEFSAAKKNINDLGFEILGVSTDPVKSHAKFVAKENLSITLLADPEATLCEAYGVWKEKSMYGKTYMGIERSTFVVSASGEILNEWRKVKVAGHVDAVIDYIKGL